MYVFTGLCAENMCSAIVQVNVSACCICLSLSAACPGIAKLRLPHDVPFIDFGQLGLYLLTV